MKIAKLFLPLILLVFVGCSSINVTTDYDTKANFKEYKTFAFYKPGIDKAEISDLDKKRIMRAIEAGLIAKGMQKSETPDVLVSLYTKSRERVNVHANVGYGYGWGYGPFWGYGNQMNVNSYTEGTLFIDIIDAKAKDMVWQGIGSGALSTRTVAKKEERIKEFVEEILTKFPPQQ